MSDGILSRMETFAYYHHLAIPSRTFCLGTSNFVISVKVPVLWKVPQYLRCTTKVLAKFSKESKRRDTHTQPPPSQPCGLLNTRDGAI